MKEAFTYDAADNLLAQVDRRGNLTEHRYDLENRRTHTTRAGLLIEQLEYDAEGNAVVSHDAKRQPHRVAVRRAQPPHRCASSSGGDQPLRGRRHGRAGADDGSPRLRGHPYP